MDDTSYDESHVGDTWHDESHVGHTWHGACVIVTLGVISGVMVILRRRSKEDKDEWEERRIGYSCWNRWGEIETKRRKERKRKKERKRERERGRTTRSFLDLRRSKGRSSLSRELSPSTQRGIHSKR